MMANPAFQTLLSRRTAVEGQFESSCAESEAQPDNHWSDRKDGNACYVATKETRTLRGALVGALGPHPHPSRNRWTSSSSPVASLWATRMGDSRQARCIVPPGNSHTKLSLFLTSFHLMRKLVNRRLNHESLESSGEQRGSER